MVNNEATMIKRISFFSEFTYRICMKLYTLSSSKWINVTLDIFLMQVVRRVIETYLSCVYFEKDFNLSLFSLNDLKWQVHLAHLGDARSISVYAIIVIKLDILSINKPDKLSFAMNIYKKYKYISRFSFCFTINRLEIEQQWIYIKTSV